MDKLDPEISAAWADEARDRLAAYRRGDLAAVDETEVFGDLDRPEFDSGRVAAIPEVEVFEKVRRRLGVNQIPARPQAESRSYAEILAASVAAAGGGEFADEEEVARFSLEHGE